MLLKIEHLRKSYGEVTPLKDVSCEINKGDVISVIGPSGCGKSTFINCLNRLIEPTSGKVFFNGEEITPKSNLSAIRMKMGMVFQAFHLFAHLTVLENIMLAPLTLLHKDKQQTYAKAMELLKMVGLESKADRYPFELSGGQQQRVAICRSLAMEPEIILFDEPTSALDPTMVGEVQNVIRHLADDGMTMIIVTHEMNFARSVANQVFYMDDGGIYEKGTPEQIFEHPQKERTRWFIQRMKLFEEKLVKNNHDFVAVVSRMQNFCSSQLFSPRTQTRIQLLLEEYLHNVIFPTLQDEDTAVFQLVHNEQEKRGELSFSFPGEAFKEEKLSQLEDFVYSICTKSIIPGSLKCSYADGMNTLSMYVEDIA